MVSKKPRKQRLSFYKSPLHVRHKFFSARLSPELRERYGCRSLPLRTDDKVRIMRGDFKTLEGEVVEVDRKKHSISVSGAIVRKADGTEINRPIHPSNVMIVKLKSDKKRDKILERRSKIGKERSTETP